MKNLKYLIPFVAASLFPMYWQFMAAQFVWLASDAASRAILAMGTVWLIGMLGFLYMRELD